MTSQETLKTFDKLYDETYDDVLKYVVCKCSNIDDVKDIVQNIYLDVYKKLLKNEIITKPYIIGISKHKVNDYYRFNYKHKLISFFQNKEDIDYIDNIPDDIDIEKSIINTYDTELVWQYLKNKKVIVFKIFYLYFKLELTIKEVSKYLDVTESNVKYYLYKTLKELNTYLEGEGDKNV